MFSLIRTSDYEVDFLLLLCHCIRLSADGLRYVIILITLARYSHYMRSIPSAMRVSLLAFATWDWSHITYEEIVVVLAGCLYYKILIAPVMKLGLLLWRKILVALTRYFHYMRLLWTLLYDIWSLYYIDTIFLAILSLLHLSFLNKSSSRATQLHCQHFGYKIES